MPIAGWCPVTTEVSTSCATAGRSRWATIWLIHFKIIKDAQNQDVLHAIQELRSVFPYELPNASEDHQPFTIHKARLTGDPNETKPVLRGQP